MELFLNAKGSYRFALYGVAPRFRLYPRGMGDISLLERVAMKSSLCVGDGCHTLRRVRLWNIAARTCRQELTGETSSFT